MHVSGEPPRSEPSGAMPPVTVIRIRASSGRPDASITSRAPDLICSRSGSASPRPAADRASRARCRLSANGTPRATLTVSKTPSPTTSPWSKIEICASASGTSVPLIQTVTACHASVTRRSEQPTQRRYSVRRRPPERRGEAGQARLGNPDGPPRRPPLDPAQLQQAVGDRGSESAVQVRAALRPVQAGTRETAPGPPDLGHVHAETGQLVHALGGDLVGGAMAGAVPGQDPAAHQRVEQRHASPPGQVVIAC